MKAIAFVSACFESCDKGSSNVEWVLCSRWRNLGLVNDLKLTKFKPRSGEESKDAPNDTPPLKDTFSMLLSYLPVTTAY